MSRPPLSERKSFFFFSVLVFITALSFFYTSENFTIFGIMLILWGLFGLLRFVQLMQSETHFIPKLFNLPTQILFGVEKIEKQHRLIIFDRLIKADILIFMGLATLFLLWVLYTNFFPAEFSSLKNLRIQQELITPISLSNAVPIYNIVVSVGYYVLIGLVLLMALSYSQHRYYFEKTAIFLLPLFLAAITVLFFNSSLTHLVLFPDTGHMKGVGAGYAGLLEGLSSIDMSPFLSPLMVRYIELGFCGAYGPYILFFPALFMLVKTYRDTDWSRFVSFIGLGVIIHLIVIDFYWQDSVFIPVIYSIGLAVLGLCWGASVQDRRTLIKSP